MKTAACTLFVALAGCGDGVPRPACPDHVHARFSVSSRVTGKYDDCPLGGVAVVNEDGCRRYMSGSDDPSAECGGDCDGDELCYQGECVTRPTSMDIGVIHVTGTDPELELAFTGAGYSYTSDRLLHQPGQPMAVSGGGAGEEPFRLEVVGTPELTAPATSLTVPAGEDLVIVWDPADPPTGARVVFQAGEDHLWTFYGLDCWSDDTGQMIVPASDLDWVADGDGVVPGATLRRITHATAETERGCAVLQAESDYLSLDVRRE